MPAIITLLRTFDEWDKAGYKIKKGSKAIWVNGIAMFATEQCFKKENYRK